MKKKERTELVCILDRSGSMSSIRNDAIGGFNTFLSEQKKEPGTTNLSLILFDNEYLKQIDNVDIQSVEPLTMKTYVPRGSTALLDAVGKTINEVDARILSLKKSEKPDNVIFCILTDGHENTSKEFKRSQIKKMIEDKQADESWVFIFLAANQDAFAEAGSLGISRHTTADFFADSDGTQNAFYQMNESVKESKARGRKK